MERDLASIDIKKSPYLEGFIKLLSIYIKINLSVY